MVVFHKEILNMKKIYLKLFLLFFVSALLISCGKRQEPLESIVLNLKGAPEYSVILADMKEEGAFSKSFYHKYKIIQGDKPYMSNWLRVSRNAYQTNQKFLGMTLVSKTKDGKTSNTPYPPGYQYLGNPEYGNWRQDRSGNSFWEFYGKYALMSQLFGWGNRSFYRNDYNAFRSSRSANRPYFGQKNEYGTGGTRAKRTNPSFFERKMAKNKAAKSRFSNRVNKRFGGGRSTFGGGRGGFGGFGK